MIVRRATAVFALILLLSGIVIAVEFRPIEDWAWRYDARHDILPDWLWNRGIPGNPYLVHGGRLVRR